MAVFQNIPDDHFNPDTDFIVRESSCMNYFIGGVSFIFALAFCFMSIYMGIFLLLCTIPVFARAAKKEIIMRINKKGFYYYGKLITSWESFIEVSFIDDVPLPDARTRGLNDQFSMMVKYYKDGAQGYYGRKIPFTDTQDKSEEEIIAAIRFYYKNRNKVHQ
jgi:hypothetical protein